MDEFASPKAPTGSPGYRRRAPHAHAPSPRPHPSPSPSPTLRAAALTVANGGGKAAVGFLKGCSTSEGIVSSQQERTWASRDGLALVDNDGRRPLDERDVVAPATPPVGEQRPSRLKMKRGGLTMPGFVNMENERCPCCTKEEFWIIYDVFASMDRRQDESVSRSDFLWALGAHGASVEFQRVVRRSRLSAYFKSTARDISLQEVVRRILPNATGIDVLKMLRWVSLRKARNLLTSSEFTGSTTQLKQLFSLLEDDCSGTISPNELLRAQILSRAELVALLPSNAALSLTFEQFTEHAARVLTDKYVDKENLPQRNGNVKSSTLDDDWDLSMSILQRFGKRAFSFPFVDIPVADDDPASSALLYMPTPDSSPTRAAARVDHIATAALITGLAGPPQQHADDTDASSMWLSSLADPKPSVGLPLADGRAPASPARQRCLTSRVHPLDVSPVCCMEQSRMVPAF